MFPPRIESLVRRRFGSLPRFEDATEQARALGVVRWIDFAIERRIWDEAELVAKFCIRSPAQMLLEGHIHYAAPCPDLAGLTADLLLLNGIAPALVLARVKRPFRPTKFQCGVEATLDGTPFTIGWSITSRQIEPGAYAAAHHRQDLVRIPWEPGWTERPYLEPFGIRGPMDLERVVRSYDHRSHLLTYRRTRSRRSYRWAVRRSVAKARAGLPFHVPSAGRFRAADAGCPLEALGWRDSADPTRDGRWRAEGPIALPIPEALAAAAPREAPFRFECGA